MMDRVYSISSALFIPSTIVFIGFLAFDRTSLASNVWIVLAALQRRGVRRPGGHAPVLISIGELRSAMAIITRYVDGLIPLLGETYARRAGSGLQRAVAGFIIDGALALVLVAFAFAVPGIFSGSAGTLLVLAVLVVGAGIYTACVARWINLSYSIRRDLRRNGYTVRHPADLLGAARTSLWLKREGIRPDQIAAVGNETSFKGQPG